MNDRRIQCPRVVTIPGGVFISNFDNKCSDKGPEKQPG